MELKINLIEYVKNRSLNRIIVYDYIIFTVGIFNNIPKEIT